MPSLNIALAKIAALVGGAVVGTLLAHWVDDLLVSRAQIRLEAGRTHYERGLAPLSPHREREENQLRSPDMPPHAE